MTIGYYPQLNYDRCVRFYYQLLSDYDRKAYREIYDAIKKMSEGIRFSDPDYYSYELCWKLFKAVILDNPALFWVYFKISYTSYTTYAEIRFHYNINIKKCKEYRNEVEMRTRTIYEKIVMSCSTEYDVEKSIHDYLTANVEYTTKPSYEHAHTLIGPLLHNKGVCEGISNCYNYLLNCFGIRCLSVVGNSDNNCRHMWNIIIINNTAYHVDVTFDLQCTSYPNNHTYFNRDDDFMKKDRTWSIPMMCVSNN